MKRRSTFQSKRAQIRIRRLLALLKGAEKPLPSVTIAEKLHCDTSLVTEYIRHLKKEPRLVRIADYDVVNGTKRALYALGAEADAPMTRQSNGERYALVKNDPARRQRRNELARKRAKEKRAALKPDQRQRDRRVYDPPLEQQIPSLLEKMPGYTTEQIAQRLNANERAVQRVVQRLRKAGTVQRAANSTMKAHQWELPHRPMAAVPRIRKPQGVFAALGL
jgi:predicted transcriptional regulator